MPLARPGRRAGIAGLWGASLAGLVACGGRGADCGPREATALRVIDGDTIVVSGDLKIRYLLVNAPETTNGHTDCYGANASQFNSDLVLGKPVQLTYDTQCQDMFGRTLAYVTVDGQDVNRLLVERGYGCVLYIPPDGMEKHDEYETLEAAAKAGNKGMWGFCTDGVPCASK